MSVETIERVEVLRVAPRWIFVCVTTDSGAQGWGECIVPKRARAVEGAVADLADNIIGSEVRRIEDLYQRMHRDGFFRGGPILATAAAGIEQALWDLKGRLHGLAAYEFLGGPVRDTIDSYVWVGGDEPAGVVEHARRRMEHGFTAVKMNATGSLDYIDSHHKVDEVVARVDALRAEFRHDLRIAMDFHGRVHRAMAKALFVALEPYGLMWIEEPVSPECYDALVHVAHTAGSTPIATGERLTSRWEFKRLLADGVVDILQPDVSLTGLFELEKIARMAEAYDVAVAPHCPNGPISLAASLQIGFCCGNVPIQEQSAGLHYNQGYAGLPRGDLADYLRDPSPLLTENGVFQRTDGAGLGIDIDRDAVMASPHDWTLHDPNWRHEDGRYAEW
ncbi:galactonate dehydratase [Nocardioidaceae bacterium SCSIO 66511]|nr:galactonate dehydratase [Nocardioidaceae bacterium SCSIO 66511]